MKSFGMFFVVGATLIAVLAWVFTLAYGGAEARHAIVISAIVAFVVKNALAISSVVRPHTSRSVNGARRFGSMAG